MIATMLAAALAVQAANAGSVDTDSANSADMHCLAAITLAANSGSIDKPSTLYAGAMYFVGRIDGRSPDYDLGAGLQALLASEDAAETLRPEFARCGALLQKRGADLERVGNTLRKEKPDDEAE